MPRISKRTYLIVAAILILVLVCGLLTGGITYGTTRWFGGQTTIQLEDGTKVGLWLNPTDHHWDVPYLAHYQSSKQPYTLVVFVPEPDPTWESARIIEVVVVYEDGIEDRQKGGGIAWRRGDREMALFRGPLRNLVTRHESCTISVVGSISTKSGETANFSFSHKFEAEPEESFFAPYWWVLGQQG